MHTVRMIIQYAQIDSICFRIGSLCVVSDDDLLARDQEIRELLREIAPSVLGNRIRRARRRQGLSIRDLAQRAGVDKSSVVRLEGGSAPQPLTLIKISAALGFHLATLLNGPSSAAAVVAIH